MTFEQAIEKLNNLFNLASQDNEACDELDEVITFLEHQKKFMEDTEDRASARNAKEDVQKNGSIPWEEVKNSL